MHVRIKTGILMILASSLLACAPEIVPTTGPHPATLASQVKIYQKQPSKYEKLGILELPAKPTTNWQESADATPAFTELRTRAAALGANGLLLMDDNPNANDVDVGAKFEGQYYLVPVRRDTKSVLVQAIWVISE